jgi:hypothetical protein
VGWCSGTEIFDKTVKLILQYCIVEDAKEFIVELIKILEFQDWDCQQDSEWYDNDLVRECFKEVHPDWFIEYTCPHCGKLCFVES